MPPQPSSPQIDHVVIAASNLEQLGSHYEALGFTLTPRAEHSWGTANRLAQFGSGNFLELLDIDRPALIPAPDPDADPPVFSFGAHVRDFLGSGHGAPREGMCMLVLAGTDAPADVARFRAAGLQTYAPFDFERNAILPDGREVTVAFSLAFATHPALPDLAFFTCHNRFPENFWKPAFQQHDNGASALTEVVLVAPEPHGVAAFCAGFTGGAITREGNGLIAACGPHRLSVITPSAFAARYGDNAPVDSNNDNPHFGALVIKSQRREPGTIDRAAELLIEWQ